MAGLVLEGGTLRATFSAGVMDALIDNNINFDYVIGVSAGITNAVSYVSKQKERNLDIVRQYRNDKRYLSKRNYLKCKSLFGLDFVFDEIPNKLIPFDMNTYQNFGGEIRIGITNAETGVIEYKDGKLLDSKCKLLRATCAIPLVFPPQKFDGIDYFDGGLTDPIPIKKSIEDGNTKNLVILTQPKGYAKELSKSNKFLAKYYRRKYPKLAKVLLERHTLYNDTIKFIEKLEQEKPSNIVVLRPEYKLSSFEDNVQELEKTNAHGYETCMKNLDRIKKLLEK